MKSLRPLLCGFILRDTLLLRPPLCDNGTNWERLARFPPPPGEATTQRQTQKHLTRHRHTHTNTKNLLWNIQIAKCSDNRTNWERSSRFPPPIVKQFPSFQDSKLHANFWLLVVLQFVWNYMKICSPFEMVKRGWHQFIFHWHFYNNKLCLKWRWLARDCIIKGGYLYKKRFFSILALLNQIDFAHPNPTPLWYWHHWALLCHIPSWQAFLPCGDKEW